MQLIDILSLVNELLGLIKELDGFSLSDSGVFVVGFAGVITHKKNN